MCDPGVRSLEEGRTAEAPRPRSGLSIVKEPKSFQGGLPARGRTVRRLRAGVKDGRLPPPLGSKSPVLSTGRNPDTVLAARRFRSQAGFRDPRKGGAGGW